MEAQDSVMNPAKIKELLGESWDSEFLYLIERFWAVAEAQAEISFKAGAKAMYDLMSDATYTHIEMKEGRYPEYISKVRGLLCPK